MQENKKRVQFRKLPSAYTLSAYERIFFPKWLLFFWPKQQYFLWGMFFLSVFLYAFVLAWLNGYKIDFTKIRSPRNIPTSKQQLYSTVYEVGGIIIDTDKNNNIKVFNDYHSFNLKPKKFYSIPAGIYNLDITSRQPGFNNFVTKIFVYKEFVFKDKFFLPRKQAVLVESLGVSEIVGKNLLPKIGIKRIFNDQSRFILLANKDIYLFRLAYNKLLKDFSYTLLDLSKVKLHDEYGKLFVAGNLTSRLNDMRFLYDKDKLLGLSKDYIIVIDLGNRKGLWLKNVNGYKLEDVKVGNGNYYLYKNGKLLMLLDTRKIVKTLGKGWLDAYDDQIFFWQVKDIGPKGLNVNLLTLQGDKIYHFKSKINIPCFKVKRLGLWNSEFYYIVCENRIYFKSFEGKLSANDFNIRNYIIETYHKLNENFYPAHFSDYGVFVTLPFEASELNQIYLQSRNLMGAKCKEVFVNNKNVGTICFNPDTVRLHRLSGFYKLQLEGYTNSNLIMMGMYLFLNRAESIALYNPYFNHFFNTNLFEQLRNVKQYEILGAINKFIIVYNKDKKILQIYEL